MELSPGGRIALGALALVVAGFALGRVVTTLATEQALTLLAGSVTLLVLVARSRTKRGD